MIKFKIGDAVVMNTTGSFINHVTDVRDGEFKDTGGWWWSNHMADLWDGKPLAQLYLHDHGRIYPTTESNTEQGKNK